MTNSSPNLLEKSRLLLQKKDHSGAIKVLAKELKRREDPVVRNNLAMAFYLSGEHKNCLDTLDKNLSAGADPNPFAHSLAALALVQLGKNNEAKTQLEKAVADFETGVSTLRRGGYHIPDYWAEYTVMILRAAGALQDHRRVYELYRRWQNLHNNWESTYLGGVAAFNLKKYRQAARCWALISHYSTLFTAMQRIALLSDQEAVPPFIMDYKIADEADIMQMTKQAMEQRGKMQCIAEDGAIRMFFLSFIFDEEAPEESRKILLEILVEHSGEWGEKLAKSILHASRLSRSLKTSAAFALVKSGVYREGEPIPSFIDGQETELVIKSISSEVTPEEEEKFYHKLRSLLQDNELEAAAAFIEEEINSGRLYPDAIPLLARIYCQQGDHERLESTLELLKAISTQTGDPGMYLALARLYADIGEYDRALTFLEKIDANELEEDQQQEMFAILNYLQGNDIVGYVFESMRQKIEEKPLGKNPALSRGLKNMPAGWLNAACAEYGINPARLRKDREKQVIAHLKNEQNLAGILQELEPEAIELLKYLLEKDGWSRMNAVTRKFDSMEGDGFFWDEVPPFSPIAQLWYRALLFVGRCKINGRNTKIATIPVELRPVLEKLLRDKPPLSTDER